MMSTTRNPLAAAEAPMPRPGSGAMFDRIARRYDLLNRLMSLGIDRRWRRRAVAALELVPGARVLDLATGTGDVALEILHREPSAKVVGLDPAPRMLAEGQRKVADAGLAGRIVFEEGDAEALPYADSSFDGVTIAFGIRNVPDRDRALAEMARVTRPGGRIVILELTEPRSGLLAPFARFYIHRVVPTLGAWLSGAQEYNYLQRSIAAFPPAASFADQMAAAGLTVMAVQPLSFGACGLFVATPAEVAS